MSIDVEERDRSEEGHAIYDGGRYFFLKPSFYSRVV